MALLMSSFLGNYHRIYDVDNKKIYFSYIESSKNGDNGDNGNTTNNSNIILYLILIIIGSILLISFATFIVILIITKRKGSNLENKINSISFSNENKEKEEDTKLI